MLYSKYNHLEVESGKYDSWLKKDLFKSGDLNKTPFCIVVPPPNVTGKLHLGHAWDGTLQDIIIRYKRMDGHDALWLPGMDHAGIATQAKVDAKLKAMGIKPREMNREEWLKHAWSWKDEYAKNIREQWGKLGFSLDYSKERFTLDQGLNDAVKHVFVTLYNKGYIYRGERIINWDPDAMTALSNEEVIYKEIEGKFYHLKYIFEDKSGYLEVATTRPETLFGDTAVAVNPKDDRYKHLIGKKVYLPVVNKLIPIIGDDYADMEFGTGVVKITPAHDPNDFEVGNRHNLERIKCISPDGSMNENAKEFEGLDRFVCREKLLEELKKQDLLISITSMVHSVGHSERTDSIVEPYLSKQWFVKMDILAKQVLDNQKADNKVEFVPDRFEKILIGWMENIHDWCISRQLWWGHRIPAWYKGDEVYVGYDAPTGDGWIQDNDVLDTWFSSALWPFSTLNWPNDLDTRYYPTNVLVTGYDIIFFWVARMVFQGLEFTHNRPFKECLIHGLIRDKDGRKMSKSLGNGVDPMDVIEKYGADSLRYFISTSSAPGQDLRFDDEKVKATWNFINKLWNASRFVMMNLEDYNYQPFDVSDLNPSDKWILTKLNNNIKKVRKHMDSYEFNVVGAELYSFIWNDFCDWYIELSKLNMNDTTRSVLVYTLKSILKMLHPFMPYVTEEIYLMLPHDEESIMVSNYPTYNKELVFDIKEIDDLISIIGKVRKIKLENNLGKDYYLVHNFEFLENNKDIINRMTKANVVLKSIFKDANLNKIEIAFNQDIIYIYYYNQVNIEDELENLKKESDRLTSSIERRKKLLNNQGYISKAPENIVVQEQEALLKEEAELNLILSKLKG
jgi:valyl-tRNA synthetase